MTKKEEKELQAKAIEVFEQYKKREKKVIALHCHPDSIKQSIKDLKEWAETDDIKNLFEDLDILVNWALNRLPIVPPPEKEKGDEQVS